MINWITIGTGAPKPKDCQEIVFWARGSVRVGAFDSESGGFDEYNTGLRWTYPKVTHWCVANEPDMGT